MTLRRKRAHAYHHNDLRNALVEEALVMLSEEGDSAFTLRDLARRVGVSHAAPYAHFSDRRALLAAVAVRGYQELCRTMSLARQSAADPSEQFIEMGIAYVLFGWHNPAHYRLMFQAPELAKDADLPELREAGAEAYAMLDACVRVRRASSLPGCVDPATDSITTWSHVHGMTSLMIDRHDFLGISTEAEVVEFARASIARMAEVGVPVPAVPLREAVAAGA